MKRNYLSLAALAILLFLASATHSQTQYLQAPYAQVHDEQIIIQFAVNDSKEVKIDSVVVVIGETVKKVDTAKLKLISLEIPVSKQRAKHIVYLQAYSDGVRLGETQIEITEKDVLTGANSVPLSESKQESRTGAKVEESKGDANGPDTKKKSRVTLRPPSLSSSYRHFVAKIIPENLPDGSSHYILYLGKERSEHKRVLIADKTKELGVDLELERGNNLLTLAVLRPNKDGSTEVIKEIESNEVEISCEPCSVQGRSFNTRAIVGIEQVGASAANSETHPFIDLYFSVPIGGRRKPDTANAGKQLDPRFSIWTDFRLTSTTVQSFASLGNLSTNALAPVFGTQQKLNNVVQSFQLNAGVEYRLFNESDLHSFLMPAKTSLNFIAGGGVSNPLRSDQTAQIFKIPTLGDNTTIDPRFTKLFDSSFDFTDKTNVAFVTGERDRFYRRWFAGMRLKTSLWDDERTKSHIAPAMFDLTIGQDEAITKKLTNKILTFDGFTPFPIAKADFIYLFGGVTMRLTRKVEEKIPSFFFRDPTSRDLTDPGMIIIPIDVSPFTQAGRDTFRFGVGVDLVRLFTKQ